MHIRYDCVQETNACCTSVGIKADLCRYKVIYVFDLFEFMLFLYSETSDCTKATSINNTVYLRLLFN